MSNDLLDLGDTPIVLFDIYNYHNCNNRIGENVILNQNVLFYPGTVTKHVNYNVKNPISLNFSASLERGELNTFLIFFTERVAMLKPFWLLNIENFFRLYENIQVGDEVVKIERIKNLENIGIERLAIVKKNGDIFTRLINSVTQYTDYTAFEITTSASNVVQDDILYFCYIYYGRFNQDNLDIACVSDNCYQLNISFFELVSEYPEVI